MMGKKTITNANVYFTYNGIPAQGNIVGTHMLDQSIITGFYVKTRRIGNESISLDLLVKIKDIDKTCLSELLSV